MSFCGTFGRKKSQCWAVPFEGGKQGQQAGSLRRPLRGWLFEVRQDLKLEKMEGVPPSEQEASQTCSKQEQLGAEPGGVGR